MQLTLALWALGVLTAAGAFTLPRRWAWLSAFTCLACIAAVLYLHGWTIAGLGVAGLLLALVVAARRITGNYLRGRS